MPVDISLEKFGQFLLGLWRGQPSQDWSLMPRIVQEKVIVNSFVNTVSNNHFWQTKN